MNKFVNELKSKIQGIRPSETSITSCTHSWKESWYGSTCERNAFLINQMSKLFPRVNGSFRVTQKINDNAYKIELSADYGVSATFNVVDLSPYFDNKEDFRFEDESSPTRG